MKVRADNIIVPTGVGTKVVNARNHAAAPYIDPNAKNSVPTDSSILAFEKSLKK